MSMRTRAPGGRPGTRKPRGRFAIALIGALALTLGPGAIAANAAAPEPNETATTAAVDPAVDPTADQPPAVAPDPVPDSAVQEPAVPPVPDPVVDPAVEPPAPEPAVDPVVVTVPDPAAPVPDPDPVVEPAPVVDPEPAVVPDPVADPEPSADPESSAESPDQQSATDEPDAAEPQPAETAAKQVAEPAKGGNANPHVKVRICHATGTDKYVTLWPNANGDVSGHAGHQGGRDIIPAFTYNDGGEMATFPGQNMDAAGTAIYDNDCVVPEPEVPEPGTPSISLTAPECVAEGQQPPVSIAVTVSGLTGEGASGFELTIEHDSGWTGSAQVLGNGVYALPLHGLGEYRVEVSGPDGVADWTSFVLDDCSTPPPPVSFCHVGDTGQMMELSAEEVYTMHFGVDADDVIPPFQFEGSTYSQNWDADGIAYYERGCAEAPVPQEPTISVSAPECLTVESDEPGSVAVLVSGETEGGYTVTVSDGAGWSGSADVPAGTDVSVEIALPGPGTYTATLWGGEMAVDSATFTVDECDTPPEPPTPATVSVSVDQCTVPGGDPASTATVALGDLVVGTTYRVRLFSGATELSTRLVVAAGTTATVGLTGLEAGSYTVRVDAAAEGPQHADPWRVETEFSVNACPTVVTPPPPPEKPQPPVVDTPRAETPRATPPPAQQVRAEQAGPALAVTGTDDSGWIAGVGAMLLLAGAATVLTIRRRGGAHDPAPPMIGG